MGEELKSEIRLRNFYYYSGSLDSSGDLEFLSIIRRSKRCIFMMVVILVRTMALCYAMRGSSKDLV